MKIKTRQTVIFVFYLKMGLLDLNETLHGVQVGLLNWAGNNPPGLRLLPLGNAHLD